MKIHRKNYLKNIKGETDPSFWMFVITILLSVIIFYFVYCSGITSRTTDIFPISSSVAIKHSTFYTNAVVTKVRGKLVTILVQMPTNNFSCIVSSNLLVPIKPFND